MATRYYVNEATSVIYVSPNPDEHKAMPANGFRAFSAYDAMRFADHYRSRGVENTALPTGFTLLDMAYVTAHGKSGKFGTYRRIGAGGMLWYHGERYVKTGRGQWSLIAADEFTAGAAERTAAKVARHAELAAIDAELASKVNIGDTIEIRNGSRKGSVATVTFISPVDHSISAEGTAISDWNGQTYTFRWMGSPRFVRVLMPVCIVVDQIPAEPIVEPMPISGGDHEPVAADAVFCSICACAVQEGGQAVKRYSHSYTVKFTCGLCGKQRYGSRWQVDESAQPEPLSVTVEPSNDPEPRCSVCGVYLYEVDGDDLDTGLCREHFEERLDPEPGELARRDRFEAEFSELAPISGGDHDDIPELRVAVGAWDRTGRFTIEGGIGKKASGPLRIEPGERCLVIPIADLEPVSMPILGYSVARYVAQAQKWVEPAAVETEPDTDDDKVMAACQALVTQYRLALDYKSDHECRWSGSVEVANHARTAGLRYAVRQAGTPEAYFSITLASGQIATLTIRPTAAYCMGWRNLRVINEARQIARRALGLSPDGH